MINNLKSIRAYFPWAVVEASGHKLRPKRRWRDPHDWVDYATAASMATGPGIVARPALMTGHVPGELQLDDTEAWGIRNELHVFDLDKCLHDDGMPKSRWLALVRMLVDLQAPIEVSVSGYGLHAFVRIPLNFALVAHSKRKAVYQLKDGMGQMFAAGGGNRAVILTENWWLPSSHIPVLDWKQARALLEFCPGYKPRREYSLGIDLNMPGYAGIARHAADKKRDRAIKRLEQGHDLTHEFDWTPGERHNKCMREFWCAARFGIPISTAMDIIGQRARQSGLETDSPGDIERLCQSAYARTGEDHHD